MCVVKVLQVNKKCFANILWTLYLYFSDILRIILLHTANQVDVTRVIPVNH
jgi:hypothetical protein